MTQIERAGRLAHSLISTAGTLGASRLAEISVEIEKAAESHGPEALVSLLSEAQHEQAEVLASLKGFLDSCPESKPDEVAARVR